MDIDTDIRNQTEPMQSESQSESNFEPRQKGARYARRTCVSVDKVVQCDSQAKQSQAKPTKHTSSPALH